MSQHQSRGEGVLVVEVEVGLQKKGRRKLENMEVKGFLEGWGR